MHLFPTGVGALRLGAVILSLSQAVTAFPWGLNETHDELPLYLPPSADELVTKRADAGDFWLRIMPLGASIVAGNPIAGDDPDQAGNGFRKAVRDHLRHAGWKVNMVGSKNFGKMSDNDHEAVPGETVEQAHDRAKTSAPLWKPNLYLINCGTNDARLNLENGAGGRMRSMIETLFKATPDATVILSTLLEHGEKEFQPRVVEINKQYRQLVRELQGSDPKKPLKRVYLAEMQDGEFIVFPRDYSVSKQGVQDKIHPNFYGFKKMAAVWIHAFNKVNELGWLRAPSDDVRFGDGESHSTCKKEFGSGGSHPNGAGVQVTFARDATIRDDGPYAHRSKSKGVIIETKINKNGDNEMYWAQLVDFGGSREQALDELIVVDTSTDHMWMWRNRGGGNFDEWVQFKTGHYCINRGIRWGDINGDGYDDYICITPDGTAFATINTSKPGQAKPTFGSVFKWHDPVKGFSQERVFLGDIDGDGRLDYCVMKDNGDIQCWRNGGLGNSAAYWQDLGTVFKSKNTGDRRGVRFVDINGDGRSDWIWLDKMGATQIWINKRGTGRNLIPDWQRAYKEHPGMGESISDNRAQAKFGRIYGNGFADYAFFKAENCLQATCTGRVYAWENDSDTPTIEGGVQKGSGGRWQKGDGVRWGDMTGTGFDDYVWISAFGQINIFPNKNTKENFDWYKSNAWGAVHKFETNWKWGRRGLHIGDWNGDGKADIIAVDRDTGILTIWFNNWDKKSFNWRMEVQHQTAGHCTLGWGVLYHDTAHHFADITGNGKVDYVCVARDGRMTARLNLDNTRLVDAGQIKYSEDLDRANFKFADVDGDGMADILHIDKFTGDARVFYNEGRVTNVGDNKGSSFKWGRPQKAYRGSSNGPNMQYPVLSGQGRADMVEVQPNTAWAFVSFNTCPSGGADDDKVVDPDLPKYSPKDEADTGVDPPKEHWFCDVQADDWTTDLWNKYDVGKWFELQTEEYSALDKEWPQVDGGVPRVIAGYDGFTKDSAYSWPGPGCQDIRQTCSLSASDLRNDKCKDQWQRGFSLWSIRNFVLFLQNFHDRILEAAIEGSFDTSLIATNFLTVDNPDMSASAWLTMASGMATAFASFIPGVGGAVGNSFAGMATAAAGIMAGVEASAPQDVRFDKFVQLQGKLSKMTEAVKDATENYFNRLITQIPPNHDLGKGTELARIVKSGLMASQDFGTDTTGVDQKMQRQMIRAPLLSEVWNAQKVFIVKFGKDTLTGDWFHYSPCYGDNREVETLGRHNACPGDANYMIGRFTGGFTSMFPESLGTSKDTLDLLGFSKELIIRRAQQIQERTGTFKSGSIKSVEDNLRDLSNQERPNPEDSLWFNIPVCDLTKLDSINFGPGCSQDSPRTTFKMCLPDIILKNCRAFTLNGQEWPL